MDTAAPAAYINNRYLIEKKLGEGGMGAVFRVRDTQMGNRLMALKIMKKIGFGRDEAGYHALFKREFEVLAGLNHPHVARSFDYGPILDGSGYFFTSEFVRGINLLEGTRNVGIENLLEVMVQACRAIDYVHSRGLIHHDLKPDNILLTEAGIVAMAGGDSEAAMAVREEIGALEIYLGEIMIEKRIVKVIDFGLIMGEMEDSARLFGTPQYMPPEKIRRERCGKRGDLYSLGVVFYQIFTRRLPFVSMNMKELFQRIVDDDPIPPRQLLPEMPPVVEQIILRLLAKDPAARFATAGEVIHELNWELQREYSLETEISAEGYITSGKFVGRVPELGRVVAAADAAFDPEVRDVRAAQVFLVAGERGIGKTRFVREIKRRIQLRDVFILDLDLARFKDAAGLFVREVVFQLEDVPAFAGMVNGGDLNRAREFAAGDPADPVPEDIIDFLADALLALSAHRPVCVVFSSLADAGLPLRRFLLTLAGRIQRARGAAVRARILVLAELPDDVTAQPVPAPVRAELSDPERFVSIMLERLSSDELATLIASMFGQGYVPRDFIDRLYEATLGNPRYLVEVLMDLTAEGRIVRTGRNWRFDRTIAALALPPSHRRAIITLLGSLDQESSLVINVLAAIRRPIAVPVLQSLTGFGPDQLAVRMAVLVRRRLVAAVDDGRSFQLPFDFLYDAVREGRDPAVAREISTKLAAALEQDLASDQSGQQSIPLAELYLDIGDLPRAVRCAVQAGEQLAESRRYAEVRRILDAILPRLGPTDYIEYIKVASRLAEIHETMGELLQAAALYRTVLERGAAVLKGWNKAILYRKIAHLMMALGDHAQARACIEEGRAFIVSGPASVENGMFTSSEALLAFRSGRFQEGLNRYLNAERLMRLHGDGSPRNRRELLNNDLIGGAARYFMGDLAGSSRTITAALGGARETGFEMAVATANSFLGLNRIEEGAFADAAERLGEARRIFQERSDGLLLNEADLHVAQNLLYQNRHLECLDHVEKVLLATTGRPGLANITGKAYYLLGHLNRIFARYSLERQDFQHCLACFEETGNEYMACAAVVEQAEPLAVVGKLDEAAALARRGEEYAAGRAYLRLQARALHVQGMIAFRRNDPAAAARLFEAGNRLMEQTGFTYLTVQYQAEYLLYQAVLCPDRIDDALVARVLAHPLAAVPMIRAYATFASGIRHEQAGRREAAWTQVYEAQAIAAKIHLLELQWISNCALGRIQAARTGNAANRFVANARRTVKQITKTLSAEESNGYLSSAFFRNMEGWLDDPGGPEAVEDPAAGDVFARRTAITGHGTGTARTIVSGADRTGTARTVIGGGGPDTGVAPTIVPGSAAGRSDDSSHFLEMAIAADLADATFVPPPPADGSVESRAPTVGQSGPVATIAGEVVIPTITEGASRPSGRAPTVAVPTTVPLPAGPAVPAAPVRSTTTFIRRVAPPPPPRPAAPVPPPAAPTTPARPAAVPPAQPPADGVNWETFSFDQNGSVSEEKP
ncbi:MAG: protein kinase [Planctomycetota bacterium]